MPNQIANERKGLVEVDFKALTAVCAERGEFVDDVLNRTNLMPRTKIRIQEELSIRRATLGNLLRIIGPQHLGRILKHRAPSQQNHGDNRPAEEKHIGNWTLVQALTEWITLPNELQYQVSRVRHRHLTDRFGRAKCYELKHLPDEKRERLREHLERHPKTCSLLSPNLRIPINRDAFPDPDAFGNWWVIDEWIDGKRLSDMLAAERLPLSEVVRIGQELGEGLKLLHANSIVRRELSPEHVILRNSDRSVVLTDFELAKLLGGAPTVSKDWPPAPYRAPELGEGEASVSVDIYSWGRIMTYMALGVLPAAGREKKSLHGSDLPDALIDLLACCVADAPRGRPETMQNALDVLSNLK